MIDIKHLDTRVERTVTYALDGAPDTVRRHGSWMFHPDRVTVEITDGKVAHVSIGGPRLVKNGARGERLKNDYYGADAIQLAWLRAVVEQIVAADGAGA